MAARIPCGLKYDTTHWKITPERIENYFSRFPIHVDYIQQVESFLQRAQETVKKREETFDQCSPVMYADFEVYDTPKQAKREGYVVLKQYITRPCAERQNFMRVFMCYLAKVCYDEKMDLEIETPSPSLLEILKRKFDDIDIKIVHPNYGMPFTRFILPHARLTAFAEAMGHLMASRHLQQRDDGTMRLNQHAFPSAAMLNYGFA